MDKSIQFDDVADIYDYYVTTEMDIGFFLDEFKDNHQDILELMCGTGRVSLPLIQRGVQLTCIDYSAQMLTRFQQKLDFYGLTANLIEADVRNLHLDKQFDKIFIPFNSFMELVGSENQRLALQSIHKHLKDSGSFICTLHNPALRVKSACEERTLRGIFPLPDNHRLFLYSTEKYYPESGVIAGTQFYEIYDKQGTLNKVRSMDITFSLIEPKDFTDMCEKAGFQVAEVYGDYDKSAFLKESSPFMIYLLTKAVHFDASPS